MDFTIPEYSWRVWLVIALAVFVLGVVVSKIFPRQSRFGGFVTVVIYILACLCGALGILQLLKTGY